MKFSNILHKCLHHLGLSTSSLNMGGWMAVVLFVVACANIGSPDGGPFDETPPKILKTSPDFGKVGAKAKKIVIEFDENIKLDNPQEKVVVSPPQLEQPEIEATGKKITITLQDSLKPGTTYTIDFADAIEDNNEGNPLGDYAFTFSTGETIDTMQISGNVLEASNLEPIKGILVGLYTIDEEGDGTLPDSTFTTKPFERISRTDSKGHFVIKGLSADKKYRVFALQDQDQTFTYSQKSEKLAFNSRVIQPSCRPDVRQDTVWHDSIYYDSIVEVPYTHFYPDDIILTAFTCDKQDRHLLKSERPTLNRFSIYFTSKTDTLPIIKGINFDETDAFVIEHSEGYDTLTYWIKDSLIYNLDTLEMNLHIIATDTNGILVPTVEELALVSKISKAKLEKKKQEAYEEWAKEYRKEVKAERKRKAREAKNNNAGDGKQEEDNAVIGDSNSSANDDDDDAEASDKADDDSNDEAEAEVNDVKPDDGAKANDSKSVAAKADDGNGGKGAKKKKKKKDDDEDIELPPMPEQFIELRSSSPTLDPDKNVDFTLAEPIDSVDLSKIQFKVKVDSTYEDREFVLERLGDKLMTYRLYAEWEPAMNYVVELDTGAFVTIYGNRTDAQKKNINVKGMESYSTLFVEVQGMEGHLLVQLMDGSDKEVKTVATDNGKADFYFINPGTYYMRLICDRNGNDRWDTGDYDMLDQPEEVYYYPGNLTLKSQWEVNQTWSPRSTILTKQKPLKITKQKPDKEKSLKKKNQEREAQMKRKSK